MWRSKVCLHFWTACDQSAPENESVLIQPLQVSEVTWVICPSSPYAALSPNSRLISSCDLRCVYHPGFTEIIFWTQLGTHFKGPDELFLWESWSAICCRGDLVLRTSSTFISYDAAETWRILLQTWGQKSFSRKQIDGGGLWTGCQSHMFQRSSETGPGASWYYIIIPVVS